MSGFVTPNDRAVREMLSFVLGDGLEVSAHEAAPVDDWHAATYVGDQDQVVAVCACDGQFVAYSGAALTMIPCDAAEEMLRDKSFSEVVLANFHEVMNICSRLLVSDDSPHLRLDKTLQPDAARAPIDQIATQARASTFEVSIPDYGKGKIAFLIT